MATATSTSFLDLVPRSEHADIFDLITGRLRLQDLQVTCLKGKAQALEQLLSKMSLCRPCCCAASTCVMLSSVHLRKPGGWQVSTS